MPIETDMEDAWRKHVCRTSHSPCFIILHASQARPLWEECAKSGMRPIGQDPMSIIREFNGTQILYAEHVERNAIYAVGHTDLYTLKQGEITDV